MIRRNRIYIETALNGPPISLDGINGVVPRLQAINRWITKYYLDNTGVDMETFDLSNFILNSVKLVNRFCKY